MTKKLNRPVVNSRKVEVMETLFEVPVSLHISELNEPYILRGAIVRDGEDFRFDMRLFYRRVWKNQSYFTATDKGIRFTYDDLIDLRDELGSQVLTDVLMRIYCETQDVFDIGLSDGYILRVTRVETLEGGETYVDFRKYLLHHDSGYPTPSKRGFKLSYEDILRLHDVEVKKSKVGDLSETYPNITASSVTSVFNLALERVVYYRDEYVSSMVPLED